MQSVGLQENKLWVTSLIWVSICCTKRLNVRRWDSRPVVLRGSGRQTGRGHKMKTRRDWVWWSKAGHYIEALKCNQTTDFAGHVYINFNNNYDLFQRGRLRQEWGCSVNMLCNVITTHTPRLGVRKICIGQYDLQYISKSVMCQRQIHVHCDTSCPWHVEETKSKTTK